MHRRRYIISQLMLWMTCFVTCQTQNLMINEVQVANIDRFIDPSYNYGAWVELYNPSDESISLEGHTLIHTDSEGNATKKVLDASHGTAPAKGYVVLWFDHNSSSGYYGSKAKTQIPFKLDADGGLLELQKSGATVSQLAYPPCIARCSYMRCTDGADGWGWSKSPSPKAANDAGSMAEERLTEPETSRNGGLFDKEYSFSVNIPQGCTLHYTTDGSTPIPGKSEVSRDGMFSGKETCIYRLMLTREDCLPSPVVTRTFVCKDREYALPVLCVSSAPANFFDNTIGLYVMGTNGRIANNSKVPANQNMDWERPVSIEYFVPGDDGRYAQAMNQEGSFNIFGGWTRFNGAGTEWGARPSFKLKSGKVYEGRNSFAYPIFESKPHIKIKNFLVRNGGQDQHIRIWDAAIHEIIRTSGIYLDCQAWQPAHILLNGRYLATFNLREESNKQFALSNYGIDGDEIDQWENDIQVNVGDRNKLNEWYNLTVDLAADPTNTEVWQKICDIVDIDEFCNYMAAEIYIGNLDWLRGGLKNVKGFRARTSDGKFHLVLHDVDGAFGDTDMILKMMKGTGSIPKRFCNMLKYTPFRKQFIDTYCIMDGSVFDPERCRKVIDEVADALTLGLRLEDTTAYARAEVLKSRIGDYTVRRAELKKSLQSAFSLGDGYQMNVTTNLPQARLMLDGLEMSASKFNGTMFPPFTLTTACPAEYEFMGWEVNGELMQKDSVLNFSTLYSKGSYNVRAMFEPTEIQHTAPLCINEVSAAGDIYINEYGKKADWVEIYNCTDKDMNLAGMFMTDNPNKPHKYQIQEDGINTIVPAHGYRVIWCDGKESQSQLHVPFKLENADSAYISISASDDSWMDEIYYKKQSRWKTYGRYPDGGNRVAIFDRPTIANANSLCTTTESSTMERTDTPDAIHSHPIKVSSMVAEIIYYNLQGQRINNPRDGEVVIQRVLYEDGSDTSRKIMIR